VPKSVLYRLFSQEGYESDVEEDMDEESNDDHGLKKMDEATKKMDEAKEKMDEATEKMDEATEKTEDGLSAMQLDENKTERAVTEEKVTSMRVDGSKNSEEGAEEGGENVGGGDKVGRNDSCLFASISGGKRTS
jgi:hypothetical protein